MAPPPCWRGKGPSPALPSAWAQAQLSTDPLAVRKAGQDNSQRGNWALPFLPPLPSVPKDPEDLLGLLAHELLHGLSGLPNLPDP